MHSDGAPEEPASRSLLGQAWQRINGTSLGQRVAVTLAALALYQFGRLLPAPGIDPAFSFSENMSGRLLSRDLTPVLTNFALGVVPLFSMLMLAEVFKLAFSDVRSWATETSRTRYLFTKVLIGAALALAAFQAFGLAAALEDFQNSTGAQGNLLIVQPGLQFRLGYIAGVVAGTALTTWLADQITRHGVGSGFWMLFLMPSLAYLATAPLSVLLSVEAGEVTGTAVATLIAALVLSAAAVILLARQWVALAPELAAATQFDSASDMARILLWPPFIAASATGLVAAGLNFFLSLDPDIAGETQLMQPGSIGAAVSMTIFVTVLTYAMANGMLDSATRRRADTNKLIAHTVLAAAATCVAIDVVVSRILPISLSGPIWIAIVTVFALLLPRDARAYLSNGQSAPHLLDDDKGTA